AGQDRDGRRRLPGGARPAGAPDRQLRPARPHPHHHRRRGAEPCGDRRAGGLHARQITGMSEVIYPKMAVVGCGLIGSSVIRGARAAGVVGSVVVADASEAARKRIAELGYADAVTGDVAEAVRDADLVVFAVPVLAVDEAAKAASGAFRPGCTVTDVGSVK